MFSNWKTTLGGLGAIVTGIYQIVSGDIPGGVLGIVTGIGLLTAADAKKGS